MLAKFHQWTKGCLGFSPFFLEEKKALKKAFFCDLLSRQVKGLITNLSVFLYGAFSQLGNQKNLGQLIQIVFDKFFSWICHVLSLDTRAQQVAKIQHVSQIIFLLSFVNCKPKLANFSCGWLPVWLATSQNWKKEKKRKTPSRLIQLLLVVNSYYFVNLFEMNMNYVFFHKWDVTTIGY